LEDKGTNQAAKGWVMFELKLNKTIQKRDACSLYDKVQGMWTRVVVSFEKRSVKCLPQDINCTNVTQSLSCHMRDWLA